MNSKTRYRIYEIIPGALIWLTFVVSILLSFIKPIWVIYFIIVFDLYWFLRVLYYVLYVVVSYRKYKGAIEVDWFSVVKKINDWQKIYHLVVFPTLNEPIEVLRSTFQNLYDCDYPKDKFIVVLAGEERNKEHFLKVSRIIEREFKNKFFKLLVTVHPDNMEGEMKAKGANANYAGKKAKELIDELEIPYENIIVSYFDCDTAAHKKYFSCLAYKYLTSENPTRNSYQPVVLYNNNIWDAPAAMRVAAFGTSFWLLSELARPERLFTFSSHSMSFQALVDVDFWQKDVVSDDSRIFLQCFFRYHGEYGVVPIYLPVSMDAVMAGNYYRSFKNLYKQQRRCAYGIENFPYMLDRFRKDKLITFKKKFKYLWNQVEGLYSWATAPILVYILGRLPLYFLNTNEKNDVLAVNTPYILEKLMQLAMVGLIVSAIVSVLLLPPRPDKHKKSKYLVMILQWILSPITLIFFGSIPSIEAQTRLMCGKYLGFWVTEKSRSFKEVKEYINNE